MCGFDISENALNFGKEAGIFDETLCVDVNDLSNNEKLILREKCKNANVWIVSSLVYVKNEIFEQLIDSFTSGKEPGVLLVGFYFPFDGTERTNLWKKKLLSELDFFSSVPCFTRELNEEEKEKVGAEFGCWSHGFFELWILTRRQWSQYFQTIFRILPKNFSWINVDYNQVWNWEYE